MNVRRFYSNINPKQLQLSTLQFVFWATMAAYFPFTVVFLQAKGLSNTAIGAILSLNSFISIFAQPLGGILSDRYRSVKKVFLLCMIISALIMLSLPIIFSTIGLAIVLTALTFLPLLFRL